MEGSFWFFGVNSRLSLKKTNDFNWFSTLFDFFSDFFCWWNSVDLSINFNKPKVIKFCWQIRSQLPLENGWFWRLVTPIHPKKNWFRKSLGSSPGTCMHHPVKNRAYVVGHPAFISIYDFKWTQSIHAVEIDACVKDSQYFDRLPYLLSSKIDTPLFVLLFFFVCSCFVDSFVCK